MSQGQTTHLLVFSICRAPASQYHLGGRLVAYRVALLLASCYVFFAKKGKKNFLQNIHSDEKEIPNTEELVAVAAPLPIERQSSAELRNEI